MSVVSTIDISAVRKTLVKYSDKRIDEMMVEHGYPEDELGDVSRSWKIDYLIEKMTEDKEVVDTSPPKKKKRKGAKAPQKAPEAPQPSAEEAPAPKKKGRKKDTAEAPQPEKKPEKKEKAPKPPGVLAHIVECLRKATEKHPVSKSDIVAYVFERHPERQESGIKNTVGMQVPSGLMLERGLRVTVVKNEKGTRYYLPKEETDEVGRKRKEERKKK